ncbi:MAG: hypothetical protein JNN26_22850 [Candidatus Obscuribacter sp.]|nr:hypothetical protein [Candidatus Obscuribacter sp.]
MVTREAKSNLRSGSRNSRSKSGAQVAEFSLVPLVLFLLAIPILNLSCFAFSYGYMAYSTFACVNKAAISPSYDSALTGMRDQAQLMFTGPFADFLKLTPAGGYQSTGCDLYIVSTDNDDNSVSRVGPNRALGAPLDPAKATGEYEVVSACDAQPLIPLAVPFLKDIPMLGTGTRLNVSWSKMAENQTGLATAAASGVTDGGVSSTSLNVVGIENIHLLERFDPKSWRDPTIYKYLKDTGEAVKDQDVLHIAARQNDWKQTSFFVYPANKVWIDYRATGHWRFGPGTPLKNADGADVQLVGAVYEPIAPPGDTGYMIVQVGNATPMRIGSNKMFRPNGSGILKLMPYDKDSNLDLLTGTIPAPNPDAYDDNTGRIAVRIIITE